jgi:hypothetical protein
VFSPDVMSILEPGTSLIVGTVGADGEPRATRAFALTVVDDETNRVRVVVSADDPVAIEHLHTGAISVTAADVRTLRSVQLKGLITAVEPSTEQDIETMEEHSALFIQAVTESDGHDVAVIRRMLAEHVVSVEFVVDELFNQSPGPGAGSPVALGR